MRVFVYEHVCATGLGREPASPEHSLFVEGLAMLSAITADFAAVPGVELLPFPDDTPANDREATFARLAATADWSLVIAPETGGTLERLARLVQDCGGRSLGAGPVAVAITSDKVQLANLWSKNWVPSPDTLQPGEPLRLPLVCKPRDGCGSEGVYLVHSVEELAALPSDPNRVVQEFIPGQPASVAFLIGPSQVISLLPTFQCLSDDGRFRYHGGVLPIPPELAERAIALGRRTIACVPGLFGYVGVDLVLGERDVAIEINPRLTTSYVGLRAASETNLAGAMLDLAEGRVVEVEWRAGEVRWGADGTVVCRDTQGSAP